MLYSVLVMFQSFRDQYGDRKMQFRLRISTFVYKCSITGTNISIYHLQKLLAIVYYHP